MLFFYLFKDWKKCIMISIKIKQFSNIKNNTNEFSSMVSEWSWTEDYSKDF